MGLSLAHAQGPPAAAAGQLERDRGAAERQRRLERRRLDYPPPGGAAPAPPQKFNISVDDTGSVFLTPIRKGASKPIPTYSTLDDLIEDYPLKK